MKTLKILTLDKGWHDQDAILLHAAFQVLMDFVERERPEAVTDWNATKDHKQAWNEIRSLYTWWKEKRPARRSPLDDKKLVRPRLRLRRIPDSESSEMVRPSPEKYAAYYRALKAHSRLEEKWFAEDQRNLHRLIEIRGFLWT